MSTFLYLRKDLRRAWIVILLFYGLLIRRLWLPAVPTSMETRS